MDPSASPKAVDEAQNERLKRRVANGADGLANYVFPLHYPVKLLGDIMAAIFQLVSPYTPNLIPLAVFLLALPVIAFLSASAGWLVWKSVAVAWETELALQYGDGVPPYAEVSLANMVATQPYDISLHLVVPATESNLALGNFMASLTISSPANKTLIQSRKAAIVLPRSSAPWSFLSNWHSTVDLTVPLLRSVALETSRATATIELGRRDRWKSIGNGEGRELSVLIAVLRGVVVRKGIRGLVARFPLTSAFMAAGTSLFISFIVLASCLLPALELRFNSDPYQDKPPPRRRRLRRRPSMSAADTDGARRNPKLRKRSRSASVSTGHERRSSATDDPSSVAPSTEPRVKSEPEDDYERLEPDLSQQERALAEYYAELERFQNQTPEGSFRLPDIPPPMGAPDPVDETFYPLRRRASRSSSGRDADRDD